MPAIPAGTTLPAMSGMQSKGETPFLAFLGEKRLAQEQYHKQKPQRK